MPIRASDRSQDDVCRIHARRLFPGLGAAPLSDQMIEIRDGVITAIAGMHRADAAAADARFDIIAPGFIDLQINGAGGVLFNDRPDQDGIRRIIAAARQGGTCHLLPTFITAGGDSYRQALAAVSVCDDPEILGVHLEGPFLSPDRPGIHPAADIRRITEADLDHLCGFDGRMLLTLAPEEVAPETLARLHKAGVFLFAGHSNSDSKSVEKAYENGLLGVTHLFNACSQMTAREPGVVGAALTHHALFAGIIADGFHVHPASLTLAARQMEGRLFLVTDAMPSYGGDGAGFSLAGRQIDLVGGRLQSSDGTLAGAHLGLDEAVRNMVALAGVGLAQALHMASGVPATVLRLQDRYGQISAGRVASLTCLADDLTAEAVMVHGRLHAV